MTIVTADHDYVTMFRKLHQSDSGSVLVLDSRYRIDSIDQEKAYFGVAMEYWPPLANSLDRSGL